MSVAATLEVFTFIGLPIGYLLAASATLEIILPCAFVYPSIFVLVLTVALRHLVVEIPIVDVAICELVDTLAMNAAIHEVSMVVCAVGPALLAKAMLNKYRLLRPSLLVFERAYLDLAGVSCAIFQRNVVLLNLL